MILDVTLPSCTQETALFASLSTWPHPLPHCLNTINARMLCLTSASSSRPCSTRCSISCSLSLYSSLFCRHQHQCALSKGLLPSDCVLSEARYMSCHNSQHFSQSGHAPEQLHQTPC